MTQPDPWSAQAQGQPVQPYGPNQTAPLPASTANPQQAYGDAYTPYNSFDDYQGYGGQVPPPPGQQVQPGQPPQGPTPPRKNTGLIIAIIACVLLLAGVIGAGILLLNRGDDADSTAAASSSARNSAMPRFPTLTLPSQVMPRNPQESSPSLPDLDPNGSTMGTITTIDGSTLQIKTLLEDTVKVKTDDKTKVISLTGSKVSDLKAGDMIMVQGEKDSDGSIRASTIISMSLGDK